MKSSQRQLCGKSMRRIREHSSEIALAKGKAMRRTALWSLLILVVVCSGCSSSGSQPILLTFPSGSTQALDNGQSVTITVSGAGTQGVTWSLAGPGSLANQTSTSLTYNAPRVGAAARVTTPPVALHSPSPLATAPTPTLPPTSLP